MRRLASFALTAAALLALSPGAAVAKKPAQVFKGKVILAKWPFPMGFKSDKAFIRHMKKVDTKTFEYDEEGRVEVHLMAFFRKAMPQRSFAARLIDTTEGERALDAHTIDAMPGQKKTRILASSVVLRREDLPWGDFDQRTFVLAITLPYGNKVLAETTFSLRKSAAEKAAEKKKAADRLEAQRKEAERLMNED